MTQYPRCETLGRVTYYLGSVHEDDMRGLPLFYPLAKLAHDLLEGNPVHRTASYRDAFWPFRFNLHSTSLRRLKHARIPSRLASGPCKRPPSEIAPSEIAFFVFGSFGSFLVIDIADQCQIPCVAKIKVWSKIAKSMKSLRLRM